MQMCYLIRRHTAISELNQLSSRVKAVGDHSSFPILPRSSNQIKPRAIPASSLQTVTPSTERLTKTYPIPPLPTHHLILRRTRLLLRLPTERAMLIQTTMIMYQRRQIHRHQA